MEIDRINRAYCGIRVRNSLYGYVFTNFEKNPRVGVTTRNARTHAIQKRKIFPWRNFLNALPRFGVTSRHYASPINRKRVYQGPIVNAANKWLRSSWILGFGAKHASRTGVNTRLIRWRSVLEPIQHNGANFSDITRRWLKTPWLVIISRPYHKDLANSF